MLFRYDDMNAPMQRNKLIATILECTHIPRRPCFSIRLQRPATHLQQLGPNRPQIYVSLPSRRTCIICRWMPMQREVNQLEQPASSPPLPLPPGQLLLHGHLQLHRAEERDVRGQGERGEGLPVRRLPQPHRVRPLRCRVHLQTRLPETRVIFPLIFPPILFHKLNPHHFTHIISSYYFLLSFPHTISSQFFLIVFPYNDILWSIETVSSSIIIFSGLEAGSALDGRASASPTRTPPSHQSLRTLLPTRSSWSIINCHIGDADIWSSYDILYSYWGANWGAR